jgi:alkylation response protein AidB-like acyl-CoA dehydrogenase
MITFALSEDQEMVRETIRKLAAEEIRPRLRDLEGGGDGSALERKLHDLGTSLIDVPEALGGAGLGLFTATLVHEELAFGDPGAAVALFAPHLVPAALAELAEPEQARRLLLPFGSAVQRGAVAWSETGAEHPPAGLATRASQDGDGWVLDGKKDFVVNAGIAQVNVVFAQIDPSAGWEGVGAFVVAGDNPGLRAGRRAEWLGLETVHAGELVLEGCRVAEADRLARVEVATPRRFFARAALVTAARQVGLARAAYETALAYTQDRQAFGKTIAHFQAVAFNLADMHMDVESARWMVWRAAWELDQGAATALTSVAKASVHASESAWRVADDAVQLHGGAGYIQDFPVEKWLRDTKALALLGGCAELAQLSIASAVLDHELGAPLPGSQLQPVVT